MVFNHFKTSFYYLILFLIFVSCGRNSHTEDGYTIEASITDLQDETAILQYFNQSKRETVTLDSASISDGSFVFKGKLKSPREVTVTTKPSDLSFSFFAENSTITISGNLSDAKKGRGNRVTLDVDVTGSRIQKDANAYSEAIQGIQKKSQPIRARYDSLNRAYIAMMNTDADEDVLEKMKAKATKAKDELDQFVEPRSEITQKFITEHPNSHFAASLYVWRTNSHTYDENVEIFNSFSDEVQDGFYGRQIKQELEKLKQGSPGAVAYNFKSVDFNGDSLALSDYRGQYVLLDFWASWCGPCRAGNPHLLDLYAKYHEQGFEIIGIADDDNDHEAWREAVAEDGIGVWKHVLRGLKYKQDSYEIIDAGIGDHYAIHTLPTKILINPEGVIVGRYGGGGKNDEALDKKLNQIFEI